MNWILTGLLLGSLVTSTHETEEACLGRQAALARLKEPVAATCHPAPSRGMALTSGSSICTYSPVTRTSSCR